MQSSAKSASQPSQQKRLRESSAGRITKSATLWLIGIYGVMVPFVYREIFRLMFWARSMNW